MKKIVAALCIVFVGSVFAQGQNAPEKFDVAKKRALEIASKRLAVLNEFKMCVEKANDQASLRECKRKEGGAMREIKDDNRPPREPGQGMENGMDKPPRGQGNKPMM